MGERERYVHNRLMELACIAEVRALDTIEKEEEKALIEELEIIVEKRQSNGSSY